jgi:hypothetical protein
MLKVAAGFLALLMLSGCAGRAPQIGPLVLASDQQLDCEQIQTETKANNEKIAALANEQEWKMGQNVVAGVVGFMAWPAWLGLDLQNAAGQEAKALTDRNAYLTNLSSDRCGPSQQTASASGSLPFAHEIPTPLASNAEIASSLVSR